MPNETPWVTGNNADSASDEDASNAGVPRQLTARQDMADGVFVDYGEARIEPFAGEVLGGLLARVTRYGASTPLVEARRCSVLVHSLAVGLLARTLARRGGHYRPDQIAAFAAACGLYGAIHDLGEIFGGDVPRGMPPGFVRRLKAYQHWARSRLADDLGLPEPDITVQRVVKFADMVVVRGELAVMGTDNSLKVAQWRQDIGDLLPLPPASSRIVGPILDTVTVAWLERLSLMAQAALHDGTIDLDAVSDGDASQPVDVQPRFPCVERVLADWTGLLEPEGLWIYSRSVPPIGRRELCWAQFDTGGGQLTGAPDFAHPVTGLRTGSCRVLCVEDGRVTDTIALRPPAPVPAVQEPAS